ncbi:PILR alpha-associated neural protein [Nelusetta ayraudi]|uniref:PILR alpha-associated neural protein n=1 Tax=Nelusetta ayraudi TaxID=303726 RepID=UPI003F70320B
MERCSISPVARAPAPRCLVPLLLLVALAARPSACNQEDADDADKEATDAPSAQLSVTGQVTPTPLWAVVWGPTQQLEDETYHFLSSQETDAMRPQATAAEYWLYGDGSVQPAREEDGQQRTLNREGAEEEEEEEQEEEDPGAEETETEEVDPQFYVTVTISTLLVLTAVIITVKLCYDRSCSRHQPPLSRGGPPPLSLALPRSLASEDSRQTLHSTSSSFADRERIPVVNL